MVTRNYKHIFFSCLHVCIHSVCVCVLFTSVHSKVLHGSEQIVDPLGGQGMGPVLWFCIMTSTLMRLTKYSIYFTCGFQGYGKKKKKTAEFFQKKKKVYTDSKELWQNYLDHSDQFSFLVFISIMLASQVWWQMPLTPVLLGRKTISKPDCAT